MLRAIHCTLLVLSLLTGCNASEDDPAAAHSSQDIPREYSDMLSAESTEPIDLPSLPAGTHLLTIHREDGTTIRFTLVIPPRYSGDEKCPLIVALHFAGEVTPFYGRGVVDALVRHAFRDLNAIIVAPDSIVGGWTNEINEQAVLQVTQSVLRSYNVDSARVALTGFSMGGAGAFFIGGRNQTVFSAVLPVAGRPYSDAEWKTPIYAVHSEADTVVPCGPVRDYIAQLQAAGADATLHTVPDLPHYNTAAFVPALRTAVLWLRKRWGLD
jgi:dipeptidyl aminopeptidase/acylaminoacyl peptidase